MRCGFGTCGLMIQTSGHNHGSLRYIEAIPHRVSPRFTMSRVSVAGAAAAASGALLLPAARAASVAVIGAGPGAAVALPEATGAGADEPSSACGVWAQPPSTTPTIRQPAARRTPST